jgi:hypothetical protein
MVRNGIQEQKAGQFESKVNGMHPNGPDRQSAARHRKSADRIEAAAIAGRLDCRS